METEIKNLSKTRIGILFEVPWEEIKPFLKRAFSQLESEVNVPGFRQGKVPEEILEKKIGREKILSFAAESFIREKYPQFIRDRKIEVIGSPQLSVLKLAWGNPFCFKVVVDVLPEVQLPDYKKIAQGVPVEKIEVSDEKIMETLKWLQQQRATFNELQRKARLGDFISIEYRSPQIENGRIFKDEFLLGKGGFVGNFEEEIQGLRKGEEKRFQIDFPKDYPRSNLAGKKIEFLVRVNKIQEMKLPPLDDDFAKSVGRFENLQGLKKSIKEGIFMEEQNTANLRRREKILEEISQKCDFEVPQNLVDVETQRLVEDFRKEVEKELKMSFTDYLKNAKTTEEELKKTFATRSVRNVKKFVILREIVRKENIQASNREIEEKINQEVLKKYPDINTAKKSVDLEKLKLYYKSVIENEKVMQLLTKASS
ncbi:trigger factor [bacterium]|nr:trigger factor [bacterium]